MSIHQFTVSKTLFSVLLTVLGMAFILFLVLLFASMFDQMVVYISGIITEVRLRM